MNKTIKLLDKRFPFRKSAYAYKNFEDRNKRQYDPTLSSDILEYLFSCINAGYFYLRLKPEIDDVQFYELIDQMEMEDPELLYKENKDLFVEILGIPQEALDSVGETKEDVKKKE